VRIHVDTGKNGSPPFAFRCQENERTSVKKVFIVLYFCIIFKKILESREEEIIGTSVDRFKEPDL
jgi:hypothetical protein